jgi:GNAT superfamily N-acetyltransferase
MRGRGYRPLCGNRAGPAYDARMLVATATLARRIENAESTLITDFARPVSARLGDAHVLIQNIGGGTAVAAGPSAPISKIAGLGFEPLDDGALGAIEREFAARATPVRVELSALADPAIGARLTARGYRLVGFENVLGRALAGFEPDPTPIVVRAIPSARAAEWIEIVTTAFANPDLFDAPPSQEQVDRASLDAIFSGIADIGGVHLYVAARSGRPAGGASMRLTNGLAQMCGAGTLPAERRHGVQTALLQYRLADAAAHRCDLAIVTVQPGSVSQQNVQRQGFELLYTRAILVLNELTSG